MTPDEVDKLTRTLENKFRRSFIEMVRSIRQENTPRELADKIAAGRLDNMIEGVDVAVEKFSTDISAGYVRAGQKSATWLNDKVPRPVKFNIAAESALDWIEEKQADIVRRMRTEAQQVARMVIANGRARNLTDFEIASEIQRSIGLTPDQYQHVASYRNALESGNYRNAINRELADARSIRSLQAADSDGRFVSPARVAVMVDRYTDNWIRFRANNIAITEATGAAHAGSIEMLRQAMRNGDIGAADIELTWLTRGDHRVRHSHSFMSGQKRRIGDPFLSGAGNLLRYPGDRNAPASDTVHCRCRLRIGIKRRLSIRPAP